MLTIHKFQCGYAIFTKFCVLFEIQISLVFMKIQHQVEAIPAKRESIDTEINGNWEQETALFSKLLKSHLKGFLGHSQQQTDKSSKQGES